MPYTFDVLPDEPILVVRLLDPFKVTVEPLAMQQDIAALHSRTEGQIVGIFDATDLKVSFGDVVSGLAATLRSKLPEGHDETRFAGIILITQNALIKLGAQSASQPQYGGRSIMVTESMEEAMRMARQRLSEVHQRGAA